MRADIQHINTAGMPRGEWQALRLDHLGCSELGTMLGYNEYMSPGELFYQKIGIIPQGIKDRFRLVVGRKFEQPVAELWEHYDPNNPTEEEHVKNINSGTKIRICKSLSSYLRNPDYPWLQGEPDRIIYDLSGEELGGLEIKTISELSARKYEHEIPPSYIYQIQGYLLLTGLDYWELAILKDNFVFDVLPFERNESLMQEIVINGEDFMNRVKEARERIQNGEDWSDLEPAPDGTVAYERFLTEAFKSQPITMAGTQEQFATAVLYDKLKKEKDDAEDKMREQSNLLKHSMKEVQVIDFEDNGKVTWKADKNGVRRFSVNIK
jgi:predicted phage-related endonuclease